MENRLIEPNITVNYYRRMTVSKLVYGRNLHPSRVSASRGSPRCRLREGCRWCARITVGMRIAWALAAMLAAVATSAAAAEAPYIKLARALDTPVLADSAGPRDKSRLLLHFVRSGDTLKDWNKLTTVSILRVKAADTDPATLGVIDRFKKALAARHAHIDTFDSTSAKPYSTYFAYHAGGESDKGVAYSPVAGFVSVIDVAEKRSGTITSDDVKILKSIIGR